MNVLFSKSFLVILIFIAPGLYGKPTVAEQQKAVVHFQDESGFDTVQSRAMRGLLLELRPGRSPGAADVVSRYVALVLAGEIDAAHRYNPQYLSRALKKWNDRQLAGLIYALENGMKVVGEGGSLGEVKPEAFSKLASSFQPSRYDSADVLLDRMINDPVYSTDSGLSAQGRALTRILYGLPGNHDAYIEFLVLSEYKTKLTPLAYEHAYERWSEKALQSLSEVVSIAAGGLSANLELSGDQALKNALRKLMVDRGAGFHDALKKHQGAWMSEGFFASAADPARSGAAYDLPRNFSGLTKIQKDIAREFKGLVALYGSLGPGIYPEEINRVLLEWDEAEQRILLEELQKINKSRIPDAKNVAEAIERTTGPQRWFEVRPLQDRLLSRRVWRRSLVGGNPCGGGAFGS